jgi:hypothetical protein
MTTAHPTGPRLHDLARSLPSPARGGTPLPGSHLFADTDEAAVAGGDN